MLERIKLEHAAVLDSMQIRGGEQETVTLEHLNGSSVGLIVRTARSVSKG